MGTSKQVPDMDNKALLTVPEAARRLSLGRATAYRMVQMGELPSVRIGRAVRVPAQALAAWIAAHTRGGDDVVEAHAGLPTIRAGLPR